METPSSTSATPEPRLQSVRKFYFLEYFYVLLESVRRARGSSDVFEFFKALKQQYRLGESKYRKLTAERETPNVLQRYFYTFRQVRAEAMEYKLIEEREGRLQLSREGYRLLRLYDRSDPNAFNVALFRLMEGNHTAFRYLVTFCYSANDRGTGLLIFPTYSPRQLDCQINTTREIHDYSRALRQRLERDARDHLGREVSLAAAERDLLTRLQENALLSTQPDASFESRKFNVLTKRIRDFWVSHFLRSIYGYSDSLSSFDIWIYRAKQIGILHATELYPNFSGKMVYPLAALRETSFSPSFDGIYKYSDGQRLFVHRPSWDDIQNDFVRCLHEGYLELRRSYRSTFVNLHALREKVCYSLKLPESLFGQYLDESYRLNLAGKLSVKISLEVDKLPEETTLTYLKREPVMVDGKFRNIIAVDLA